MEFLINPNVSYVLLVLGFLTFALALCAPGTGLLEAGAVLALVLAGYGLMNLPVNGWAIIIVLLGLVPLILGFVLHQPRRRKVLLMMASTLVFLIGSVLLYQGEGWPSAVNPLLIVLIWPLTLGLTWLIAEKTLEAHDARPVFDLDQIVGMTGQASTDIRGEGTVYVNGEEWSAFSKTYIPAGSAVQVLRRKGLALEVDLVRS
jgi:membrane-bound serine protease (ClpP class)